MELDPVFLSRVQFAFVVSFHIIFPAFTIGLAAFITVLEGLYYWTRKAHYLSSSKFWIKILAVSFGMGGVSGIVMAFQFGTNWSAFSYASANFLGPTLSFEVITAFFLEATFLGVLLFGRDKVPQGMHLFSAAMVALGTFISSFWIMSANSWMQTPAGVELREGVFFVTSWMEAIFNPSFWVRFWHMVLAAFLTTGFFVLGVAAWYLRHNRHVPAARTMFSMTMWLVLVLAPLQVFVGDLVGLNMFEHQPAKVAAMEANWETRAGAPFHLFAIPDQAAAENRLEISIPYAASPILTHSWEGVVPGLEELPPEDRPYVPAIFWLFRIMVAIGLIMVAVALTGAWLRWRRRLFDAPRFHLLCVWMIPSGFIATLTGWFVSEIGRYPWIVYGQMRIADGISPTLTGPMVLGSLIVYVAVYAIIFAAGSYYILRLIQKGPADDEREPSIDDPMRRPMRPLSAADEQFEIQR